MQSLEAVFLKLAYEASERNKEEASIELTKVGCSYIVTDYFITS